MLKKRKPEFVEMQFGPRRKKARELNLIPLINIIFLLLIFFMVAGTIGDVDTFEVQLPKANSGHDKPNSSTTIYLGESGKVAINNDFVDTNDLKTIIKTIFINNSDQRISIKADANAPVDTLILVMNFVEEAGGKEISLITEGRGK
jgi:biopolymer transport protein ExbD